MRSRHRIDGQWLDKGLSVERNEVYVREGRTLDRTEVLNEMVLMLTPHLPYSGNTDRDFYLKTLSCVGIDNASWWNSWRPNP